MLLRAGVGFALLVGVVSLGAWVSQQRASGGSRRFLPRLAGQVHRTVGVVAIAILVMLAVTALRLTR